MTVKLLTEHHLEFLSLTGGCTGLSESTLVKMPHCLKSHVTVHIVMKSRYAQKLQQSQTTDLHVQCRREEDKQEQHKVSHIKQAYISNAVRLLLLRTRITQGTTSQNKTRHEVPTQDGSNENSLQHQNNCLNEHQMQK